MKIRSHLTVNLGIFILVSVTALFVLNYFIVRSTLVQKANEDLLEIEKAVYRSAQALLDTAIANYLRGITQANLELVENIYSEFTQGDITENEAKQKVQKLFSDQQVGESGYLVAVEQKNNKLYLDMHPFLPKVECTETEGCREWNRIRNGYTEYDWKNPRDNTYRKKAAYVLEFKPWNWIIGASSYRDEFVSLVDIEDVRALLEPIRINKSGYFFIFDKDYNWLVHPLLGNTDLDPATYQREQAVDIMKQLLDDDDGYMTYMWKNPADPSPRLKYAFIEHLEGYDWYLAASGYYSEVLEPITQFRRITIGMVILACIVLLLLIYRLSRSITGPLISLGDSVTRFYQTKQPFTWKHHTIQEINVLGDAFSRMTRELTRSMASLSSKVDELAASEREKDENRRLLDNIINSMPSGIIGVDANLRITQWNNRAAEHFGKKVADVLEIPLLEVIPELSDQLGAIKASLESNTIHTLEYTHAESDENVRVFEITVYPIISPNNKGAVIRLDEITERLEIEQRLRHSQKMDAVGQLAGGVAHDFNNMLSGIMGAAELLRMKVTENDQPLVTVITSAAGRASELILKLLAFSRKDKVTFSPVNIHTVIKDTVEILNRSLDKRIMISHALKAESQYVMGDWSQLQNSLLNIAINSGHAMEDGGHLEFMTELNKLDEVFCEHSPFEIKPGWFIQITVRDTGCGISQEHQKKIFEPFFTTKEQGKGTGLGLAAVYGTVTQHGGAISVYSELNIGTEFHILLPICDQSETPYPVSDESAITGQGCVLIIDDEPIVRMTARLMLEKLGYTTLEAENGEAGVETYKANRDNIDLVILDMIMPVMDGTRCFYQLKKINPEIRVIISSGFSRDADLDGLKQDGLRDFIRKPYSLTELSKKVANVLRSTS